MKIKIALASLMIVSFLACTNESKFSVKSTPEAVVGNEHSSDSDNAAVGLSLNDGSKWKTDESTWTHAKDLNALVDSFNPEDNADAETYHVFAASMQEKLGGLVKDCKMKGADHDVLHLWLEPVMAGVNDLKLVSTADEGKLIAGTLNTNVQKFNQYFEYAH